MKRWLAILLLAVVAVPATAADVGVSITIGEPGFYGRLELGDTLRPHLIHTHPIIIYDRGYGHRAPIYLRVPLSHRSNWRHYCHYYDACYDRVFFVHDSWYYNDYTPWYHKHYKHKHKHHDHDRYYFRDSDDHRYRDNDHKKHTTVIIKERDSKHGNYKYENKHENKYEKYSKESDHSRARYISNSKDGGNGKPDHKTWKQDNHSSKGNFSSDKNRNHDEPRGSNHRDNNNRDKERGSERDR